jgi:chromosome segregation ATPase
MDGIHFDSPYREILNALKTITATLASHTAALARIETQQEKILSEQSSVDAATAQINAEVADLGVQDAAILAAQQAFGAALTQLQSANPTVDTTALVTATANLLTAQGVDDATVAALTAAATPPSPASTSTFPETGASN